jgi:hypothetical protein
MRRIALFIIFCLANICQAQEHLRFMDIPITGTVEQFANKLVVEKGFKISDRNDYEDPNFKMEAKILSGKFEMFDDCIVVVRKIEGANETTSVVVFIDSLKCHNGEFEKLIEQYDKKYGESSGYWFNNKWEINDGRILAGTEEGGCHVIFMKKPEIEIREAYSDKKLKEAQDTLVNHLMEIRKQEQTVKEICGVPFGSSYEKTKEMLENKYGYSELTSDRTRIVYKHKSYAGITFDSILFLFQSDGIHSYLNGCVFILDAKSLSDAKKKQKMLYEKLSDKYFMIDDTDNNGNIIYIGGYPPTPDDGVGFTIEILKYDSEVSKVFTPYAARLMYGRYNYVKEEF